MCFLVLLFGLLELYLVDLDAVFGVLEVGVYGECVCIVDVFAFGVLGQRTKLGAGKGLESAFDFGFGCGVLA